MPRAAPTRRVGIEEARRIAVRSQLLDGSATGVLDTVRTLGFLQLDPIATVATPAAPRPLEPARGVRHGRARPSALGRAQARGVERVHLADRDAAAAPGADAAPPGRLGVGAPPHRVPRLAPRFPPLRPRRARGARPAPLPRARGSLGHAVARPPLVRQPPRGRDAARAARPGRDRDRRPPRRPAPVGSRRAVVSRDRARPAARGRSPARRAPLPRRRRPPRARRVARTPRRRGRPGAGSGHAALAVRPADRRPRPGRGALRLSLPPRDVRPAPRSASTATTCCRSSPETGSSDASSPGSTAPPARSSCSARGATPRGSTRPLDRLAAWLGARRV